MKTLKKFASSLLIISCLFIVVINGTVLPNSLRAEVERNQAQVRRELGGQGHKVGEHPELLTPEQQAMANTTTLEGDMELTGSLPRLYRDPTLPGSLGYDVVADKTKLWPGGRVPFLIDDRFSEAQKSMVGLAMKAFHDDTCIKFVKKSDTDENYLYVRKVTIGCYSPVGYESKPRQWVSYAPACFDMFGSIIHELMHTIGFFHSQSRSDRDQWVTVHWDRIQPTAANNFQKLTSAEIDEQNQPYDFGSLMHYPQDGFAKTRGEITLEPKVELPDNVKMGQRVYFSELDKIKIGILYNCSNANACGENEVQCPKDSNNQCGKKCDGTPQCSDGSDEKDCPKPMCKSENDWACNTVKCIRSSWLCDDTPDCPDGEDEKPENCQAKKCAANEFNCGKCLPVFRVCDGHQDCAHNEDEEPKMCAEQEKQREQQQQQQRQQQQQQQQNSMPEMSPPPPPTQQQSRPQPTRPLTSAAPFGGQSSFQRRPPQQPQKPATSPYSISALLSQYWWARQPFRQPLQSYFNQNPYFSFGFDATNDTQKHCFIDMASMSARPEIRTTPEIIRQITDSDVDVLCNGVSLGFAKIDGKTLQISFGSDENAQKVMQQLAQARDSGRILGTLIVIGAAEATAPAINALRTIGSDVDKAQQFANNAAAQLRKWNATGLTLQWLKPQKEDSSALTTLVKSFANAFQFDPVLKVMQTKRLIFGLNVVERVQPGQNVKFLWDSVDYVNIVPDRDEVRTTTRTYFTNELLMSLRKSPLSRDSSWLADSKNFKRINIGIEFAPVSFTTASNDAAAVSRVGAAVRAPGAPQPLSDTSGSLNAGEICILAHSTPATVTARNQRILIKPRQGGVGGWINSTDASADNSAFLYFPLARQWIAYETSTSLREKVRRANLVRFNGVYFMDTTNDDVRGLCGADRQFELLMSLAGIDSLTTIVS